MLADAIDAGYPPWSTSRRMAVPLWALMVEHTPLIAPAHRCCRVDDRSGLYAGRPRLGSAPRFLAQMLGEVDGAGSCTPSQPPTPVPSNRDEPNGTRVRFHDLRHTCAALLIAAPLDQTVRGLTAASTAHRKQSAASEGG